MKALRLMAIFVVLLFIAVAGLFLLRTQIAEFAITRAMARAGLENPQVRVEELWLDRLALVEIEGGARSGAKLKIAEIKSEFNLRALFGARRVEVLRITGAQLDVGLTDNGELQLPFDIATGGERTSAAPTLGLVEISDAVVRIKTTDGAATFKVDGRVDERGGGDLAADFSADAFRFNALQFSDAEGSVSATFDEEDRLSVIGGFTGDAVIGEAVINGVELSVSGTATPWRTLLTGDLTALSGELDVILSSATASAASFSMLSALSGDQIKALGGKIEAFTGNGAVKITFSPTELQVTFPAGSPSISTNRGDVLTLMASDGPVYQHKDGRQSIGIELRLQGGARGDLEFAASRVGTEPWRILTKTRFEDQAVFGAKMSKAALSFEGDYLDGRALGEIDATIDFDRIDIGRLNIRGAPTRLKAPVRIDLQNNFMQWGDETGGCLELKRATFNVSEQPLKGSINGSSLCARGGPLLEFSWSQGQPRASLAGRLVASSGMIRFGETSFRGEPPKIDLTARYEAETQSTTVDGVYSGGNVIVNEALRFSTGRGVLQGGLNAEALSAEIRLDDALISAFAEEPLFSPVKGKGVAYLKSDVFKFDYEIDTTTGLALGKGEGVHDVKSGRGSSVFRTQTLRFLPDGLQPDMLTPLLRGPISDATGAIEAVFDFGWDKSGLRTGGDIDFQSVTFRGPGLAVSQTANINGSLSLTSLLPVITNGEQSLRIGIVDLNALKLENGEVRFVLPGDETLQIVKAEFPWFDGVIGAYETTTPLSGGEAKTVLRASSVNLGALLAFLDVDGLSGEGEIEGSLPLTFDGGRARVTEGSLSASGPGVIRYTGDAAKAAEASGSAAAAFEVLRELRFNKLTVGVDGPLDGTLKFSIYIEGYGDFPFETGNVKQTVNAPITYRISLNAPLLALIQQARMTADFQLQQSQIRGQSASEQPETQQD